MRAKLARPVRGGDTGKRTSPALAPRPVSYPTLADDEDPWSVVGSLKDQLAAGSYLVISHVTADHIPDGAARRARDAYAGASAPGVPMIRRAEKAATRPGRRIRGTA